MNPRNLIDVTDEIERAIRNSIDEWVVVSKARASYVTLHIPSRDGDGPLCTRVATRVSHRSPGGESDVKYQQWTRKPTAVYPPGHKPVCRYCATECVGDE